MKIPRKVLDLSTDISMFEMNIETVSKNFMKFIEIFLKFWNLSEQCVDLFILNSWLDMWNTKNCNNFSFWNVLLTYKHHLENLVDLHIPRMSLWLHRTTKNAKLIWLLIYLWWTWNTFLYVFDVYSFSLQKSVNICTIDFPWLWQLESVHICQVFWEIIFSTYLSMHSLKKSKYLQKYFKFIITMSKF